MVSNQTGVVIESALSDWQIVQQDEQGMGTIELRGRWAGDATAKEGTVQLRVVSQETGVAVNAALDWHSAETFADGRWQTTMRVPAGGLYRLETRLNCKPDALDEWSLRGDMRHFVGVGDLWVIAGQSNSAGYGRGPVYDPPELGVHLYRNSEQWALATHPMNDSTDTQHAANRERANPGHSPYLQFARLIKRELHHPIGLVQTSLGGSALAPWNPAEAGEAVLYHTMLRCVQRAGGKVKGILWYQGESDTGSDEAAFSYGERFAKAVGAWREALGNAELPIITVQLNRVHETTPPERHRRWTALRDIQRRVAKRLKAVAVVPSLDLPLSDLVHNSPPANMLLGERMARAALGAVYGRPVDYLAPDIQAARKSPDGREIELAFQPVTSRMDSIDVTAQPFAVEDEAGEVPVEKVMYPRNATVRLTLARALKGRATVQGAVGIDPAIVPMDIERMMPMLGFYGVAVE